MKRAIIFCNGNSPLQSLVFQTLKTTDTIICANGGSKHALSLGLIPHLVIGDQDSLPKKTLHTLQKAHVQLISHPKDKDETDSELAIQYVQEKGFKHLVLFGFIGSRADHMIATLMCLVSDLVKFDSVTIIDRKQTLSIVKNKIELVGKKGDYISLIPLHADVSVVKTNGLRWGLLNETLFFGKTRGVSNELLAEKATISVKRGVLLVIHNK